jgi:hypothetical protein
MEEDFAAGACVAIQDATADLKSKMDAISKEASDWANKLEKAEDARAKIKAKATAAKADEDAGKPEERRRKPADDTEVSISKILDDKVQKDFETLMAKAADLAGSGEGSIEAIYLTSLQDFMAAQTQFLMARKVVGAFVVPEGLDFLTHESIEAHAPVVQDEQQVLADAATDPEAIVFMAPTRAGDISASRGGPPAAESRWRNARFKVTTLSLTSALRGGQDPDVPPKATASTDRPESSARAGRPLTAAAALALRRALPVKVASVSSGSARPSSPAVTMR